MIGLLAACTENTNDEIEETKVESVNENKNDVSYEISDNNWELSSKFEHSVVYENGEKGSYEMVGNKETVGFTGVFPIKAKEKSVKYFWFYFGKEDIYDKPVEVKAIKKGTEEAVNILSGPSTFYEGAEVSPDSVNMPSHLRFPSAGIWKVLVYIDGELYESIVVKVV